MPKQDPRELAQRKLDRDCDRTAQEIERLVAAASSNGTFFDLDATAQGIIDAFKGRGDVFWALDGRPLRYDGYKAGGYHSYLRSIRNSPTWGPKLFASFTD